MNRKAIYTIAAVVGILTGLMMPATASADPAIIEVWPGDNIQDAVNTATPGDTIIVHAGEYHFPVAISTDDITLKGEEGAILDGSGLPVPAVYGIGLVAGVRRYY